MDLLLLDGFLAQEQRLNKYKGLTLKGQTLLKLLFYFPIEMKEKLGERRRQINGIW